MAVERAASENFNFKNIRIFRSILHVSIYNGTHFFGTPREYARSVSFHAIDPVSQCELFQRARGGPQPFDRVVEHGHADIAPLIDDQNRHALKQGIQRGAFDDGYAAERQSFPRSVAVQAVSVRGYDKVILRMFLPDLFSRRFGWKEIVK